jgi:hypothetical protein
LILRLRDAEDFSETIHPNPLQTGLKAVTIDEGRIAERIKLIDEHNEAETALDLDRTLATLNETPWEQGYERAESPSAEAR